MLNKRIIPCLDVKDGKVVKGVNFVGIKDVGDPVECARMYNEQGADEIVFLDITATVEARKTIVDIVRRHQEPAAHRRRGRQVREPVRRGRHRRQAGR